MLPHAASGDFDPESPRRNTLTGEVGPSSLPPQLTSVQHPNAPFAPPGGAPGSRIPPPPRGPVPFVPQLPQSTRLPTPGFMSAGGLPVPLAPPSAAWKPPPSLTQPSVSRTGSGASNGTPVASLVPAHPLQPQPQQQQYEYGQYSMEAVAEVPEPLAPSGMAYFNPAYNNPVDEAVPQEQHAAQEPPQAGAWEAPSGFDPGQESMHQQQQQQYHGEYQGADQQLAPQDHAWGDVYGSNDMLPAVYGGETGEEQHAAWGGVPPVMPGGVPVKKLPPPAVSFESPLKAKFAKRVPGKSTLPPPVQRTGSTGAAILPGLPRPPAPAAPPAAAPGFGHGLGGWEGSSVASAPAPDASEGEVNQQYGQQYEQYDDQPVPAEDVFPAPVGFGAPPAAPPAAFPTFAKPINVSRVDSGASNSTPRPFEQLAPPPMGAPGGLLQPSSAKPGGMLPTPQPRGSADGPPAVFKPMVPGSPGSGKAAAIPGSPGMGRLVPPAPLGGPSQEGPKTQQQNGEKRAAKMNFYFGFL